MFGPITRLWVGWAIITGISAAFAVLAITVYTNCNHYAVRDFFIEYNSKKTIVLKMVNGVKIPCVLGVIVSMMFPLGTFYYCIRSTLSRYLRLELGPIMVAALYSSIGMFVVSMWLYSNKEYPQIWNEDLADSFKVWTDGEVDQYTALYGFGFACCGLYLITLVAAAAVKLISSKSSATTAPAGIGMMNFPSPPPLPPHPMNGGGAYRV